MKQTPREARKALINSYKCYLETIRERVETIASVNNDAFTKQVLIESAYSFIKQVDNYGHETLINHFYKLKRILLFYDLYYQQKLQKKIIYQLYN